MFNQYRPFMILVTLCEEDPRSRIFSNVHSRLASERNLNGLGEISSVAVQKLHYNDFLAIIYYIPVRYCLEN